MYLIQALIAMICLSLAVPSFAKKNGIRNNRYGWSNGSLLSNRWRNCQNGEQEKKEVRNSSKCRVNCRIRSLTYNAVMSGDLQFGVVQSDRQYQAINALAEWREKSGKQSKIKELFLVFTPKL